MTTERNRLRVNANSRKRNHDPRRIAYMKAYAASHPVDRREYRKQYVATHREEIADYRARRRLLHKEQNAEWYQANRDKILERVKARAIAKRDEILAYHVRHYEKNSAKIKATVAAYRAKYPEKKAILENRRRVRKLGNGGSHTLEELNDKFSKFGNRCFYCGRECKLTIDHDIPLARGGSDSIDNILPACKSCNSKKNTKTAIEFMSMAQTNHQKVGGVQEGDIGR